ncbi:MEDS domain-containing protein [Rubrobacter aplysinae]|uniref:MEDS domain-containing protein n=1 Tax=Rubrobacter aplysinae TaxID=909625 RepID=UPI00064B8FE9|nr:MEDS domain-containing protein [Rubrobacter aplysinae]
MTESRVPFTDEQQMLDVGAHVCAMQDGPERVLQTLALAFETGLGRGERCAYIAPEESARTIRQTLAASGVDAEGAVSRGDLVFLSDREDLLKNGEEFDPDHLVEAIKGLFGQTLEAGYAGLRLSADVPWLTRNVPGGDRALEFEEKADEIVNVKGVPLMAICQYSLSDMDPEETLDIMERHPLTLIGGQVHTSKEYGAA